MPMTEQHRIEKDKGGPRRAQGVVGRQARSRKYHIHTNTPPTLIVMVDLLYASPLQFVRST